MRGRRPRTRLARLTTAVGLALSAVLVTSSLPALAAPAPAKTLITLTTSATSALPGTTVTLSGKVTPVPKIGFVGLQEDLAAGWKTLPGALAAGSQSQGAFSYSFTLAAGAVRTFRVTRGATAAYTAGTSNTITVSAVTKQFTVVALTSSLLVPDNTKIKIHGITSSPAVRVPVKGSITVLPTLQLQTYADNKWTTIDTRHSTKLFTFTPTVPHGTTTYRVFRASTATIAAGVSKSMIVVGDSASIVTKQLPPAAINVPYKQTIVIENGQTPYQFTGTSSVPGVVLSQNILSGRPTTEGQFTVTFGVKDANGFGETRVLTVNVKGLTALAWGSNSSGQLGNAGATGNAPAPTATLIPDTTKQIVSGNGFSLALQADGTVYSWGTNGQGELGQGDTVARSAPTPIKFLSDVTSVAAGFDAAYAVEEDGSVYAWGANDLGQLGDGTNIYRYSPEHVAALHEITKVAAGYDYALAFGGDGDIYSFGTNSASQLGFTPAYLDQLLPKHLSINLAPGNRVVDIAAGSTTGYALTIDGTVFAWGADNHGSLGDGNPALSNGVGPTQVKAVANVQALSCSIYTCFATEQDGSIWSWGDGRSGALGRAKNVNLGPAPIPGLTGVAQLATSGNTTYALLNDGTVDSWGLNGAGELGNGTIPYLAVPTPLEGLAGTVQVAAGIGVGYALLAR